MSLDSGFVGRAEELQALEIAAKEARGGKGSMILIKGYAGIGKSRLIKEFTSRLLEGSMDVLTGMCRLRDRKTPYAPFQSAFLNHELVQTLVHAEKTIGFEHLFIINDSGMVMAATSHGGEDFDEDIWGGMLSIVQNFVRDSFGDQDGGAGLERLDYGELRIHIEHGQNLFVVGILSQEEAPDARADLELLVKLLEEEYPDALSKWDGKTGSIQGMHDMLEEYASKRYSVQRRMGEQELVSDRLKVFEGALKSLKEQITKKPLVLVLENLQWSDSSSLELLSYIAQGIERQPMLCIVSLRPGAIGSDSMVFEYLENLQEIRSVSSLDLGPFEPDHMLDMLESLFPELKFPPEIWDKVVEKTDGNPLVFLAYLKNLTQAGLIYNLGFGWEIAEGMEIPMPETLKDMLINNLDHLSPMQSMLLEEASVLGYPFKSELLANACGAEPWAIGRHLGELQDQGFISHKPNDYWVISSPQFTEIFYLNIDDSRKVMLNRWAGIALENEGELGDDRAIFRIAEHFYRAGDSDKTVHYAFLAGDKAMQALAPGEASRYFKWGLEMLPDSSESRDKDSKNAALLVRMARCRTLQGDWDDAIHWMEEARKLNLGSKDVRHQAETLYHLGEIYLLKTDDMMAKECIELALDLFGILKDDRGQAECHWALGTIMWRLGDLTGAMEKLELGLVFSEKIKEQGIRGKLMIDIGSVMALEGRMEESTKVYQDAVELLRDTDETDHLVRALNNMADNLIWMKKMDQALENVEQAISICEETSNVYNLGVSLQTKSEILLDQKKYQEASDCIDESEAILEKVQDERGLALNLQLKGVLLREQKMHQKAEEMLDKAIHALKAVNFPHYLAETYLEQAILKSRMGKDPEVKPLLHHVRDIANEANSKILLDRLKDEFPDFQ